jgi:hypothetical protein
MKNDPHRYRGFDVCKLRRRRIGAFGDTYIVLTWRGEKLSAHSSMRDAKAEIDRILKGNDVADASQYGCPI